MQKRTIITILLTITILSAPLLMATPNLTPKIAQAYYNGTIYNNSIILVGLNDYGVLGVYNTTIGSVGIQYPIGSNYESVAVGWWGDGWSIFYNASSAGFSPSDDPWGTLVGVTPTVSINMTGDGLLFTTLMTTNDSLVQITIKILVPNNSQYLVKWFKITNIGNTTLSNVEIKNIVDWDVWEPLVGYDDYWGLDSIRRPELHLAVAFVNTSIAPGTAYFGYATLEAPTAVDLNWDDYTVRGITAPTIAYIQPNGTTNLYIDGAVVYDWQIGDLKPGESYTIHMVYAAADTLNTLESNVAQAFKLFTKPSIGGELAISNDTNLLTQIAIMTTIALSAVIVIKRFRNQEKNKQ